MVVAIVLDPWLAARDVLGEPVADWWSRRAADAGWSAVVVPHVGAVPPGAGVVLDGACLLAPPALADLAAAGLVLAAGDGPLTVVAAPGHLTSRLGTPADDAALADAFDRSALIEGPDALRVTGLVQLALTEAHAAARARARIAGTVRLHGPPETILLAGTVEIAPGAALWCDTTLLGRTRVGAGAIVHRGCHLTDTTVEERAVLEPYTVCVGAHVGRRVVVGPFARLREGTVLDDGARVGNFVETKAAHLGPGAKANHLSYLGDAVIGAGTNVGAGTITCNYDGARKHRTVVGEGAFVGTNTALVAPVRVGDGAVIAAGSVITDDVPPGALALGRARQTTLPDKGAALLARNRRLKEGSP